MNTPITFPYFAGFLFSLIVFVFTSRANTTATLSKDVSISKKIISCLIMTHVSNIYSKN